MTTLDEAWAWYAAVKEGMSSVGHLAKYWDELPWGENVPWVMRVERDNVLRGLKSAETDAGAQRVLSELDDLAVLVLFSVFESNVRDWAETQIKPEADALRHPLLVKAKADVLDLIAEGSFFRILESYKSVADHDLVEQVNQIRRYRNWVAHGRRTDRKPDAHVGPRQAYDRLKALTTALFGPVPRIDASAPPKS